MTSVTLATRRNPRAVVASVALSALGLTLTVGTLALPWYLDHFFVDAWARLTLTGAGAALVVVAACSPRSGTAIGTAILGALTMAYPLLIALQAWHPDDPVVAIAGMTAHIPILVLCQLVPVLAASAVAGRPHRRWEAAIVGIAAASIGAGIASDAGAAALAPVGSLLWTLSFLLSPLGAWTAVRGSFGETRRRVVLAGLAATLPAVVVLWCLVLGSLAEGAGLVTSAGLSILFGGLALSALTCGILSTAAVGASSKLSHSGVLVGLLDLLLGLVAVAVGTLLALAAAASAVPAGWAAALGAALTLVAGAVALGTHTALARFVDPGSRLRRELNTLGTAPDGGHRAVARLVMRRLAADPELELHYPGAARADAPTPTPGDPERIALPLAYEAGGSPSVIAVTARESTARIVALGDLGPLLQPALLEVQLEVAQERSQRATEDERRRLTRNLHDGLQGRLLGLALNVQLTGSMLADPHARLLVDETVQQLRSLVEDVRRLGGGDVPEILTSAGLGPALRALLTPVASFVELDVPERRLPGAHEATAYFVVGEAVSNALKHADAHRIGVAVSAEDGSASNGGSASSVDPGFVRVTVSDDGRGGADPRAGSGLRALAERVDAAGGIFVVRDGAQCGTVVEAVLPCASS